MFPNHQIPILVSAGVLGGGGVSFSPLDLLPLRWFKFNDISTLYQDSGATTPVASDGDVIGYDADKSGNGGHITQTTTGNKPLYKVNIQNGKGCALFDGSDDVLNGSIVQAQPLTVFAAFKASSIAVGDIRIFDGVASRVGLSNIVDSGAKLGVFAGATPADGPAASTNFAIVTCVVNGASSTIALNGDSNIAVNDGPNALSGLTVGRSTAASKTFNGYIGELIFYAGAMSAANQLLVKTYLNNEWAVY